LINPDLTKVTPTAEAGNGLNYLQTYYAGTYAVDPKNGFALNILGFTNGAPRLEFLAVNGRTYTLLGSRDLKTWKAAAFRVPAEGTNAALRGTFQTEAVKAVQLEVANPGDDLPPTYFRLMLQ